MHRFFAAAFLLTAVAWADDETPPPSGPTPLVVQSIEDKYAAVVADLAKAKRTAADARLKSYRDQLAAHTKAGDFDKAQATKARIEQLEADAESDPAKAPKRPRPKDVVKFGGHTYALVKDAVTWHVAKQRCEEMGGHLATIESPAESAFVASLCTQSEYTWLGATDEDEEGHWKWVTGKPLTDTSWIVMDKQDENHYLGYNKSLKLWLDCTSVHRSTFVCEWDR